MPFESQYATFY